VKKPRERGKVPEPKPVRKRPSAVSRVFVWFFVLLLVSGVLAAGGAFYAYQEYTLPGPLAENKIYTVGKGLGTPEIAAGLQEAGIISDARVFSAMAHFTGTRTRLKAGEYEFPAEASMRDVMALIASGKSITYKLSVPEGWTSEMAVARVNANEILEGPPALVPPEGSIMPDTYVFRRGTTRQKLVEDMQAAQEKLLDSLWDNRSPLLPIDTKEEAVVLASIVEKETGVAVERPVIASVFMNRLKKNMRLQSDPTIIYGLVGGKGKLDRRLTRADIQNETPYNTYRINGLPPGPIANPGRAALEAVLNPQPTDYLYFVADGSGGHAFAATLEEHNANVKRWRQIAGNAAAAAAADAAADTPVETPQDQAAPAESPAPAEPAVPDGMAGGSEPPPPAPPPPELVTPPATATADADGGSDVTPPVVPPPVLEDTGPPPEPETADAVPTPPDPQPEAGPTPAPEPAPETTPTPQASGAAPTPPVPQAKPRRTGASPDPKPGSVIRVDNQLVAVPKRNPRR